MKKLTLKAAALVSLAFCLTFSACSGKSSKKSKNSLKIGVIQLVEHPALDKSYQGFVDGLKEAGYVDGENITIDYENAQGEQANCVTIAQKLVSDEDDLILAIATPAAQAVANLTSTIPVLVTAVTDPQSASLVQSNEKPGTNVSGTSDLTPCEQQINLLKKILPDAKKVAMLYCSSEENSRFQVNIAKKACDKIGLSYVDATVSNTNEVQQVVQSLAGKVDAIYSPTDNMIASCMATVVMVANENKIPTIVGEEGMVEGGGLATYGIDYYELGKQTAVMAVDVLKNGKKPADMPIQYLDKCKFSYNSDTAAELGITIPTDLQ